MFDSLAQPAAERPSPVVNADRNVLIDAARALSLLMVVGFHAGLWRVSKHEADGWPAPWSWGRSAGTAAGW